MTVSYRAQVAVAFEVLAEGLAPVVDERMSATYPDEDWILQAAAKLGKRRDVLVSLSDPHFQLEVINRWYGPAFADVLPGALRDSITDLRTARNYWAHPDPDHPIDPEYAQQVLTTAEDVLRAVGAPQADRMAELLEDLRWDRVRDEARDRGDTEADALMGQLAELQQEHDELHAQLEQARAAAQSATGQSRAVSRQLAELQTQYAAVAGLRDEYLRLQRQLEEERAGRERTREDTSSVRGQLSSTESALVALQRESSTLRGELDRTRAEMRHVDPAQTEEGQRWIWLMTVLVLVLGVLVVVAAYLPRP